MLRRTLYTVPLRPAEVRAEFLREAARKGVAFIWSENEFFLAAADAPNLVWATDIAWEVYEITVASIRAAATQLRLSFPGRRWRRMDGKNHRRAALILENLPPWKTGPAAGFFLCTPERGIAVLDSLTPLPGGEISWVEQKKGPPNRAYLKIWEAIMRLGITPRPDTSALDLGSCPGGWTWALAQWGARVVSIDGAPLAPEVARLPNVQFIKADAFKIRPEKAGVLFLPPVTKIDWLFSDMICEPQKLVPWLTEWIASGVCERFVVSVKFKGTADPEVIEKLATLGQLRHLRQNKHELTWFRAPELQKI